MGILVVIRQVFLNCSDQGRHARKAASAKALLAEFAKPTFNQIQPGTGRWGEVQMKTRMSLDPGFYAGMFMRAIIIHNQMEIEFGESFVIDYLKESDELLMPMAGHAVSDHLAVEHAQGGKQGGRSMADVIMRHCSTAAFLQGQTGLGSVKGLDLAFLVHAQNQGLVRRIQIQPDDIAQLLHEAFVPAEFKGAYQMGLQVVSLPDSPDGRFTQLLGFGHRPGTPMRCVRGLGVKSRFDHGVNFSLRDFRNTTRPGGVFFQAGKTESQKTLSPQLDGGTRDVQLTGDSVIEHPGSRFQDDLGTLDQAGREASATRPRFQNALFLGRQDDFWGCSAHRTSAYTKNPHLSSYL